ncbi:MAG: hypothetical protein RML46_00205 [Anaerolineae bacterium]|nr:hypothetical protein [Anaerolineae bacterium]MDW8067316.1 hypothetical protein [Anaerolineae bacterium]
MIPRKTQEPSYWKEFQPTAADLEYLKNLLVERERPLSTDEMARALVAFRCRSEEERIARILSGGSLYLPQNSYQVGDTVFFPFLDFLSGQVIGVREGQNPQLGPFRVIQVAFPGGQVREFAAELPGHKLNEVSWEDPGPVFSPEELYDRYGQYVRQALAVRLEAEPGFVALAGHWFLKSLLVEISPGLLNVAEAVLDEAGGGPLPAEALIGYLDMPKEVHPELALFSLNYALFEDERFDEVGPAGRILWYLRRLEPAPILEPPARLQPRQVEYDHRLLDESLLNLERWLGDEWSEMVALPRDEEPVRIVLTYPHRRSGTLPLSPFVARVCPTGRTHRIRFVFRDEETGEEMPGWVVRERRFVYGLGEWYERHNLPVGAYVEIRRGPEPGVVLIRRRPTRPKREWVRAVSVEEGALRFEMGRHMISCEYEELMVIAVNDWAALDGVEERVRRERRSLADVVAEIFPELAKLSPQGTVHAATLYSAVNLVMRVPPGPILTTLVTDDRYTFVGDYYWVSRGRPGW